MIKNLMVKVVVRNVMDTKVFEEKSNISSVANTLHFTKNIACGEFLGMERTSATYDNYVPELDSIKINYTRDGKLYISKTVNIEKLNDSDKKYRVENEIYSVKGYENLATDLKIKYN